MLQLLRNKAQSTFIQIIVVIIVLVFVFWGVGANMMGSREAALTVNSEEISFEQYRQAYDKAYQRLSDQFGGNVPKGLAKSFGLKQQVINQLIQSTLLKQGADRMNIIVSAEEIRTIIQNMVQFQDNGVFNMDRYKDVLAASRLAPSKFEASMRYDKLSEIAVREIGNFASIATEYEIEDIYSQINETVSVEYVKFSPSNSSGDVETDDVILTEWFKTVKDQYKTEPQTKIKYLAFTYKGVGNKIEIDDAKVEEYYQTNLDDFKTPEQMHARHILFKTENDASEAVHQEKLAQAEKILQLAKAGDNFADLAKQYSEGPSKSTGGDLGFFSPGQMVPPFNTAVMALKPGEISGVVKTRFGYHIILLEEIKPATTRELSEVKQTITQTLQKKEAENLAFQMANSAYEGIIAAGSLTNYAEKNPEAEIVETDFFTRSNPPEIFASDQVFLNKCFALNKNELSSLIKGSSGFAILYAEDIQEPETPAFANVEDRVKKDFIEKSSKEIAEKSAKDLLSKLTAGETLETVASESGLEIVHSQDLSQKDTGKNGNFPGQLLSQAFLLSSATPLPEKPGKVGDDFFVFSFVDRKSPELAEDSEEVKKLREDVLRFKQQQLISAWLMNQEKDATITQHQNL